MKQIPVILLIVMAPGLSGSAELEDIRNYREYSSVFASSGQPSKEQLKTVKEAGYERIIFIGVSSSRSAIPDEDVTVKGLGMDYIHIPVIFDAPTKSDFYAFAAAMQHEQNRKTLLHCAGNFRASAFAFLYRVLYEDVPLVGAKADMNDVWHLNDAWRQLILDILADNGVDPYCNGCSWDLVEQ
jgi:protein tyrosine phosphatase (PTP) superfamily phosphohydrolase (DUF442 family)